jgi:hypothetical protein
MDAMRAGHVPEAVMACESAFDAPQGQQVSPPFVDREWVRGA